LLGSLVFRESEFGQLCLPALIATTHKIGQQLTRTAMRYGDDQSFAMQTMNISLPDPMKQFVEDRVNAGAYSSVSEYVRELVRADQKRHAKEELEQILLNAMNSGDPFEVTPEMLEDVKQKLRVRAAQRNGTKR
jgi:antitoxin ParD1/3/4